MNSTRELSKEAIKLMLQDPSSEQGKDHILQIYSSSNNSLMLSDGCYEIPCVYSQAIEKYDILNVTRFTIEGADNERVLEVKDARKMYTGIRSRLGLPTKYDIENVNAPNISPIIPAEAKPMAMTSFAKPKYKPLSALALYERNWTIKVRLINRGPKREMRNAKNIHLISLEFVDEEGTVISGLISGEAADKYDKVLEKGKVYMITNGEVKIAAKKYTSVSNDFSLKLDGTTVIEEVEDDKSIKQNEFNFSLIKDIYEIPEASIIDVLGTITVAGSKQIHIPKKKDGSGDVGQEGEKSYKRYLILADESGSAIGLSLWGKFAETEYTKGTIIGCKRIKVIMYGEKQLSTITSTEIIINPQMPRTITLRELVADGSIFNNKVATKSGKKQVVIIRVKLLV